MLLNYISYLTLLSVSNYIFFNFIKKKEKNDNKFITVNKFSVRLITYVIGSKYLKFNSDNLISQLFKIKESTKNNSNVILSK
jgi:hypothetical protein